MTRRILLIVATLVLATPALADVTISATDEGSGVVSVRYVCGASEKVRAFALDISIDSNATIDGIRDFNRGESNKPGGGYGVFPGKFRDVIVPTNPNWVDPNYNPVAPVGDPDANTGLGTKAITVELGTLYVDVNGPGASGMLFRLDCNSHGAIDANLCITTNATRGKVVKEDANEATAVTGCIKVSFCTPAGTPGSITYPSSSKNGIYTVSWAASSGTAPITYTLQREANNLQVWSTIYTGTNTSYAQDVCDEGRYGYQVRASNACGTSGWRSGLPTECNIVLCFPKTYARFADWKLLSRPLCWCGKYAGVGADPNYNWQCYGDIDGTKETVSNYRIFTSDYNKLAQYWKNTAVQIRAASLTDPLAGCADVDHQKETVSNYRVFTSDYNRLAAYWKSTKAVMPNACPNDTWQ